MTREEIIEMVKTAFDVWENEYDTGNDWSKEHKARDMAIEALEQEPCKDAIDRSDMLDAIGHGTTYTSEELQRIIKGLPPVNPQNCDKCEVGNPCLYCRHKFESQAESENKEDG